MSRAARDFKTIYAFIQAPSSLAARKWYLKFQEAVLTLKENPQRFPVTPEHPDVRHLLFGKKPHVYRVLFIVNERKKLVEVLHIRHGAKDAFTSETLN